MSTLDISFNNGDLLIFSDVSVNGIFSASGTSSGKDNSGMTGEIRLWSTNTPPTSWLLCDGTSYNISTYQNLYNVISTNYGGDGTTFKVPDFRRRIPIGNDSTNTTFGSNSMNSTDGRVALNMNLTQGPPYYNENNIGKQNVDLNYIITHKHNIQSHTHDISHNHNVNADFLNHNHDISHNHIINSQLDLSHNHSNITVHKHDEGQSVSYQGVAEHSHVIEDHEHQVVFNGNTNSYVNKLITNETDGTTEYNNLKDGNDRRVWTEAPFSETSADIRQALKEALLELQTEIQQQNSMSEDINQNVNFNTTLQGGESVSTFSLSNNASVVTTQSKSLVTQDQNTNTTSGNASSKTTAETPVTESNLGVAIPNNPHFIVLNYIIKI